MWVVLVLRGEIRRLWCIGIEGVCGGMIGGESIGY